MTTEISSGGRSDVRDRWIAWLFIVGSSLFALGAVPFYSEAVGLRLVCSHLLRRFAVLHVRGVSAVPRSR